MTGTLTFYREGDFYNLYGDEAPRIARLLGIVFGQRAMPGGTVKQPMTGIPAHSFAALRKELEEGSGIKVAVIEKEVKNESD